MRRGNRAPGEAGELGEDGPLAEPGGILDAGAPIRFGAAAGLLHVGDDSDVGRGKLSMTTSLPDMAAFVIVFCRDVTIVTAISVSMLMDRICLPSNSHYLSAGLSLRCVRVFTAWRLSLAAKKRWAVRMVKDRRQDRLARLGEAVNGNGVLHLRDAAKLLSVSEMTVRRDIAASRGRLSMLGGYVVSEAELNGVGYTLDREEDVHRVAKAAACEHALHLIEPGDTLFIDCGTTTPHLASRLPAGRNLTVVCYALNVAEIIARRPGVQLVVIGGLYHPSSASFSGEAGLAALSGIRLNKAFISAGGIHPERGVSCSNFHEVPAKRAAMGSALQSFLLIDSSKRGTLRPAHFADVEEFSAIVCEDGVMTSQRGVPAPENAASVQLEAGGP